MSPFDPRGTSTLIWLPTHALAGGLGASHNPKKHFRSDDSNRRFDRRLFGVIA